MGTESSGGSLFQAVQEYKKEAGTRLDMESVKRVLKLLKDLNYRLPGKNLLAAPMEELNSAGQALASSDTSPDEMNLLKKELPLFFDVALEQGFISIHPIRGTARIHVDQNLSSSVVSSAAVEDNARRMAVWVGNLIEDGLAHGFMLSPVAVPLSEVEEKMGWVDSIVSSLSGRWQRTAMRFSWLLDGIKIAIPVGMMLFVIHAWFESGNPFLGGQQQASSTGEAVQNLTLFVNLMENEMYGYGREEQFRNATSFKELEMLLDYPLELEEKVFTLVRVVPEAATLILRHKSSGALVLVNPRHLLSLKGKRMKVVK